MDILRSEFLKYDNSKSGTISTMDFKKVLGKFGVAKGAEVVIRKFRGCNINEIKYEDFIKYFESAKKNQSIQKSSYTYQNATALKPLESLHVQGEAQSEKKEPVKRTRERKANTNNFGLPELDLKEKLFRLKNTLEHKFKQLDTDNAGQIQKEDFEQSLTSCGLEYNKSIKNIVSTLQTKSGKVEYDHFLSLLYPDGTLNMGVKQKNRVNSNTTQSEQHINIGQNAENSNHWTKSIADTHVKHKNMNNVFKEYDPICTGYIEKNHFVEAVKKLGLVPANEMSEILKDASSESGKIDYTKFMDAILKEKSSKTFAFSSIAPAYFENKGEENGSRRTINERTGNVEENAPANLVSAQVKNRELESKSEAPLPEAPNLESASKYEEIASAKQVVRKIEKERYYSPTYTSDIFFLKQDPKPAKSRIATNYFRLATSTSNPLLVNDEIKQDIEMQHLKKRIETRSNLSLNDLLQRFTEHDKNHEGTVTQEQFRKEIQNLNFPLLTKQVDTVISVFDKNNTGKINYKEFVGILNKTEKRFTQGIMNSELFAQNIRKKIMQNEKKETSTDEEENVRRRIRNLALKESNDNPLSKNYNDKSSTEEQMKRILEDKKRNKQLITQVSQELKKNRQSEAVQMLFDKLDNSEGITKEDLKQTLNLLGMKLSEDQFNYLVKKCVSGNSQMIDYASFNSNIFEAPTDLLKSASSCHMSLVIGKTNDDVEERDMIEYKKKKFQNTAHNRSENMIIFPKDPSPNAINKNEVSSKEQFISDDQEQPSSEVKPSNIQQLKSEEQEDNKKNDENEMKQLTTSVESVTEVAENINESKSIKQSQQKKPETPAKIKQAKEKIREKIEEKTSHIKDLFLLLDKNHTGHIEEFDLKRSILNMGINPGEAELDYIVQRCKNQNSLIDYNGFASYFTSWKPQTLTTMSERIRNSSHPILTPINLGEASSLMNLGDARNEIIDHAIRQKIADKILSKSNRLTEIFRSFDHDQDGKINKNDLKIGLQGLGMNLDEQSLDRVISKIDPEHSLGKPVNIDISKFADYVDSFSWKPKAIPDMPANRSKERTPIFYNEPLYQYLSEKVSSVSKDIRNVFRKIDENKDGEISSKEFKQGLEKLGIFLKEDDFNRVLNSCDRKGNGRVDYESFAKFFKPQVIQEYPEQVVDQRKINIINKQMRLELEEVTQGKPIKVRETFRIFDTEKKCTLPEENFRKALQSLDKNLPQWIIDRAVRVSKASNRECNYETFLSNIGYTLPDDVHQYRKGAYDTIIKKDESNILTMGMESYTPFPSEQCASPTAASSLRYSSPRWASRPSDSGDIIGHTTLARSRDNFLHRRQPVLSNTKVSDDIIDHRVHKEEENRSTPARNNFTLSIVESPTIEDKARANTGRYTHSPNTRKNPLLLSMTDSESPNNKLFTSKRRCITPQAKEIQIFRKLKKHNDGDVPSSQITHFLPGKLMLPDKAPVSSRKKQVADKKLVSHVTLGIEKPSTPTQQYAEALNVSKKKIFGSLRHQSSFNENLSPFGKYGNIDNKKGEERHSTPTSQVSNKSNGQVNKSRKEFVKDTIFSKLHALAPHSRNVFRLLDKDNDGKVTLDNLQSSLKKLNIDVSKHELREAFNIHDDKNIALNFKQFSENFNPSLDIKANSPVGLIGYDKEQKSEFSRKTHHTDKATSQIQSLFQWSQDTRDNRAKSVPHLRPDLRNRGNGDIIAWRDTA